jgi:hypothetical protein
LPQQYYKTSLIDESLGQAKLNFHCHDCEGFKPIYQFVFDVLVTHLQLLSKVEGPLV